MAERESRSDQTVNYTAVYQRAAGNIKIVIEVTRAVQRDTGERACQKEKARCNKVCRSLIRKWDKSRGNTHEYMYIILRKPFKRKKQRKGERNRKRDRIRKKKVPIATDNSSMIINIRQNISRTSRNAVKRPENGRSLDTILQRLVTTKPVALTKQDSHAVSKRAIFRTRDRLTKRCETAHGRIAEMDKEGGCSGAARKGDVAWRSRKRTG